MSEGGEGDFHGRTGLDVNLLLFASHDGDGDSGEQLGVTGDGL